MNAFSKVLSEVAVSFRAARLKGVMSRLSDRQLADIGFSRDDISRRARELVR